MEPGAAVAAFSERRALRPVGEAAVELPRLGEMLSRTDLEVRAMATGPLAAAAGSERPGDQPTATLALLRYTTSDGDGGTDEHLYTVVVTAIPESLGFAPYLGLAGPGSRAPLRVMPAFDGPNPLALISTSGGWRGGRSSVEPGIDRSWLHQLFGPSLLDWVANGPADLGFELADGILCVNRTGHLARPEELDRLWAATAHLAAAIRRESLEEARTGGGARSAARSEATAQAQFSAKMTRNALRIHDIWSGRGGDAPSGAGAALATRLDRSGPRPSTAPPPDVGAARGDFREIIRRTPATWLMKFAEAIALMLALNLVGAVVPISLINADRLAALAAGEAALLALLFAWLFRRHLRRRSALYAEELFFREFARSRGLTLVDPLVFAATHAAAGLPFRPQRALTGPNGGLILSGNGSDGQDRIGLVEGPEGPCHQIKLEASAAGLTAADLDRQIERLETVSRASPGRARPPAASGRRSGS